MTDGAKASAAEPTIEASIHIDAPPAAVWRLVTDLERMGRWSPQNRGGRWLRGGGPVLGARFLGYNRIGWRWWATTCKVVEVEQDRRFVFRNEQNWARWVYQLEPDDTGGTTVVERRELPDGRPGAARLVARVLFGGATRFDSTVHSGMVATLDRLKAEAEAATGDTPSAPDGPGPA
jgi:uncharacterized protein YndB with AHSA1/START domain